MKPHPKHTVVNVSDSLYFPSGKQLASVVHRAIPRGEKQQEDRCSFAYLMRVNYDLRWSDDTGKVWSAKGWHDFKFDAFRSSDTMENGMQVVTGMKQRNGGLRIHVGKTEVAA